MCAMCLCGASGHLATRIEEHIKGFPVPSEISLHKHTPNKNSFKLIACTPHHKILESSIISNRDPLIHVLKNGKETSVPLLFDLWRLVKVKCS